MRCVSDAWPATTAAPISRKARTPRTCCGPCAGRWPKLFDEYQLSTYTRPVQQQKRMLVFLAVGVAMPKVSVEHEQMRRQQILDAALTCFGRRGYHATSMEDIVREAGLSIGAIY